EGVFSIDALPAISDEWTPVEDDEGAAYGGTNGASTVYEAFDQAEASHLQRLQVDAASADARIALAALLREYDITPEDGQLILSRDIFRSSGRTVARINGRALSQQVLQQVASWLVDIHGQSEHMSLLRPDQHVNFMDRYAELLPLRAELGTKVTEWRSAQRGLGELARLDKSLQEYADNLAEAIYQLEDVAASISSYESDIEDDPRRLSEIEERLDQIARLKRKYGATIEEILERAA